MVSAPTPTTSLTLVLLPGGIQVSKVMYRAPTELLGVTACPASGECLQAGRSGWTGGQVYREASGQVPITGATRDGRMAGRLGPSYIQVRFIA